MDFETQNDSRASLAAPLGDKLNLAWLTGTTFLLHLFSKLTSKRQGISMELILAPDGYENDCVTLGYAASDLKLLRYLSLLSVARLGPACWCRVKDADGRYEAVFDVKQSAKLNCSTCQRAVASSITSLSDRSSFLGSVGAA